MCSFRNNYTQVNYSDIAIELVLKMESSFYVKFLPCNCNSFRSLRNKYLWFSRVFDFDDFYEYQSLSISCAKTLDKDEGIVKCVDEWITRKTSDEIISFLEKCRDSFPEQIHCENFRKKVIETLSNKEGHEAL